VSPSQAIATQKMNAAQQVSQQVNNLAAQYQKASKTHSNKPSTNRST